MVGGPGGDLTQAACLPLSVWKTGQRLILTLCRRPLVRIFASCLWAANIKGMKERDFKIKEVQVTCIVHSM